MQTTMKCPRDAANLFVAFAEGHTGYHCDACAGTWVPYGDIQSIKFERAFDAEKFTLHLENNTVGASALVCPKGCRSLNVAKQLGIDLDWCPSCKGVWFDGGELRRLLTLHPQLNKGDESDGAVTAVVAFDIIVWILSGFMS